MGETCEECGCVSTAQNPVVLTVNGFLCLNCAEGEDEGYSWEKCDGEHS
jgi:hypothetical protein